MKNILLITICLIALTGCSKVPIPIGTPSPDMQRTVLNGTWVVDIPKTVAAQTHLGLKKKYGEWLTINELKQIKYEFLGDRYRAVGPHFKQGDAGSFTIHEKTKKEIVIRIIPDYEPQVRNQPFEEIKNRSQILGPIRYHFGFRFITPDNAERFDLYPWRDGVQKRDQAMYFKRVSTVVEN